MLVDRWVLSYLCRYLLVDQSWSSLTSWVGSRDELPCTLPSSLPETQLFESNSTSLLILVTDSSFLTFILVLWSVERWRMTWAWACWPRPNNHILMGRSHKEVDKSASADRMGLVDCSDSIRGSRCSIFSLWTTTPLYSNEDSCKGAVLYRICDQDKHS